MTSDEIAQRRLAAQDLAVPRGLAPNDVVARLGAVQAQDYHGAKWALAQRIRGAVADADVERAFTDGTILRTHVLRPTWHFVVPADIRWMLALTAPRVRALMAPYDRKLGLTDDVYRRSNAVLAKALEGSGPLERAELAQVLTQAGIDTTGTQRLAHLVMRAELEGIVCSGPRRGNQFTYALLDERAAPVPAIARDEALGRLATLYFTTRGPATAHDFACWSGLTIGDARRAAQIAAGALDSETIDGAPYWMPASPPAPAASEYAAHLLPNYDEYFIGFRDRSALSTRVVQLPPGVRSEALFGHILVVGGQIVGGWRRTLSKHGVVITRDLLVRLTRAEERAVKEAEGRYGAFLGLAVERMAAPARGTPVPSSRLTKPAVDIVG